MFVTMFTCLAGAAVGTAALLEASIHRSGRRGTTRGGTQAGAVRQGSAMRSAALAEATTGNAELYSLAAYRSLHRSTHAGAENADEGTDAPLAEVVQLDFRRGTDARATRWRARA